MAMAFSDGDGARDGGAQMAPEQDEVCSDAWGPEAKHVSLFCE